MQRTICQRGHLEDDPLWNAKPVQANQCIGDVFGSPHVKDKPGCSVLNGLQTLDETGRQVDVLTMDIREAKYYLERKNKSAWGYVLTLDSQDQAEPGVGDM